MRRQIAIYLEDLDNFRQVRPGNSKDLEQFADLLDIAIINLKETNQHHELGNGSLYAKLQRKLPQIMLASYRRWIFENNVSESVGSLRRWVIQESEFQTEAAETVYGVSGRDTATRECSRGQDKGMQKLSLETIVTQVNGAVRYVDKIILFGNARPSFRKVFQKNGTLQNVSNFVFGA